MHRIEAYITEQENKIEELQLEIENLQMEIVE